jgi:hypothetical protein
MEIAYADAMLMGMMMMMMMNLGEFMVNGKRYARPGAPTNGPWCSASAPCT